MEVLTKVYMALGTPTDESWGGLRAMPAFMEFQPTPAPGLRKIFPSSIVGVSLGGSPASGNSVRLSPAARHGGVCAVWRHRAGLPACTVDGTALSALSPCWLQASSLCLGAKPVLPWALQASDEALDLLSRMMSFDASTRISAADALQHRYFRTEPLPSGVDQLPKPRGRQPEGGGNGSTGEGGDGAAAAGGGAGGGDKAPQQRQQQRGGSSGGAGDAAGGGGSAAQPPAAGEQPNGAGAAAGPSPTPPFMGRPLSAIPESLLGRGERPKLNSSDVAFFKKRKFNLDDALEDEENAEAGAS